MRAILILFTILFPLFVTSQNYSISPFDVYDKEKKGDSIRNSLGIDDTSLIININKKTIVLDVKKNELLKYSPDKEVKKEFFSDADKFEFKKILDSLKSIDPSKLNIRKKINQNNSDRQSIGREDNPQIAFTINLYKKDSLVSYKPELFFEDMYQYDNERIKLRHLAIELNDMFYGSFHKKLKKLDTLYIRFKEDKSQKYYSKKQIANNRLKKKKIVPSIAGYHFFYSNTGFPEIVIFESDASENNLKVNKMFLFTNHTIIDSSYLLKIGLEEATYLLRNKVLYVFTEKKGTDEIILIKNRFYSMFPISE